MRSGPQQSSESISHGSMWAITAYFDPLRSGTRLRNFREFRKRLGIPLVAVELAFGDSFDLGESDAEVLIQHRGGALLWQKERLLNLAVSALPPECETVAVFDSDIILLRDDWAPEALRLLDDFAFVQPFQRLHYLSANHTINSRVPEDPEGFRDSFAYLMSVGEVPEAAFSRYGSSLRWNYNPGSVWVVRRSLLENFGPYDALILGSGDKLMMSTAYGRIRATIDAYQMNQRQQEHYVSWAEPFYEAVNGSVTHLEGDILHLWHGSLNNRHYGDRYQGFEQFDFDPYTDIARNGGDVWGWNSDKPALHAFTRRYFHLRKDGQ